MHRLQASASVQLRSYDTLTSGYSASKSLLFLAWRCSRAGASGSVQPQATHPSVKTLQGLHGCMLMHRTSSTSIGNERCVRSHRGGLARSLWPRGGAAGSWERSPSKPPWHRSSVPLPHAGGCCRKSRNGDSGKRVQKHFWAKAPPHGSADRLGCRTHQSDSAS